MVGIIKDHVRNGLAILPIEDRISLMVVIEIQPPNRQAGNELDQQCRPVVFLQCICLTAIYPKSQSGHCQEIDNEYKCLKDHSGRIKFEPM